MPFVFTDHQRIAPSPYSKIIRLNYDYGPNLNLADRELALPYIMHPQIYTQYKDNERLNEYRAQKRNIRLLFAGSWDSPGYSGTLMPEVYNMMSRYGVVQVLRNHPQALSVKTLTDLDNVLNESYTNRIVLIDCRVNQSRWLALLGRADFFVCAPGIVMPMSHSAIESMAVGTIPLTNYPNWFIPALLNQSNSVVFTTSDDLKRKLDMVLSMDESTISLLRQNVLQYYDQRLDPRHFMNHLMNMNQSVVNVHVLDEDIKTLRTIRRN